MGEPKYEKPPVELENEWEKSSALMQKFYGEEKNKTSETIASATREFLDKTLCKEHFVKKDRTCLVCIDEGCVCSESIEDLIALAGSGIVTSTDDEKSLQQAARLVEDMQIDIITSHAGCGAGKIAFSRLSEKTQQHYRTLYDELSIKDGKGVKFLGPSDLYAADFAQSLATETKRTYDHIDKNTMVRPESMHNARMIVVDMTGRLQLQRIENFPKSFLISGRYLEEKYRNLELKVAVDIALGDHGFGDKFNENEPLLVIVLGTDDHSFANHQTSVKRFLEEQFVDQPVQMITHAVSQELIS